MLNSVADYIYVRPCGIRVDGGILPTRGHAECLVRGEDLAFLAEAVQERSDSPREQNLIPCVRRSSINNRDVSIRSMNVGIRGLFARFVDPSFSFGHGQWSAGEHTDADLPAFSPYTAEVDNDAYRTSDLKRLDGIRAMYADVGRCSRLKMLLGAFEIITPDEYGFYGSFSFRAGEDEPVLHTPSPGVVRISGGLGNAVLSSAGFACTGGYAIVRENVNVPGQATGHVRWKAVRFGDYMTIPSSAVSPESIQSFAASLGWSRRHPQSWTGTSYVDRVYADLVFPASFDATGWGWSPENH